MHLGFYIFSVLVFMVLGFFTSSYWIIASMLLTIYVAFVIVIYLSTKKKANDPVELNETEYYSKPSLTFSHASHHEESVLEEHEVSPVLFLVSLTRFLEANTEEAS